MLYISTTVTYRVGHGASAVTQTEYDIRNYGYSLSSRGSMSLMGSTSSATIGLIG